MTGTLLQATSTGCLTQQRQARTIVCCSRKSAAPLCKSAVRGLGRAASQRIVRANGAASQASWQPGRLACDTLSSGHHCRAGRASLNTEIVRYRITAPQRAAPEQSTLHAR
eukprot:5102068-Pleurochrysis_carterae.AAC.3